MTTGQIVTIEQATADKNCVSPSIARRQYLESVNRTLGLVSFGILLLLPVAGYFWYSLIVMRPTGSDFENYNQMSVAERANQAGYKAYLIASNYRDRAQSQIDYINQAEVIPILADRLYWRAAIEQLMGETSLADADLKNSADAGNMSAAMILYQRAPSSKEAAKSLAAAAEIKKETQTSLKRVTWYCGIAKWDDSCE